MEIKVGKKMYFVPDFKTAIYGTITAVNKNNYGVINTVTITTKSGKEYTGYSNQFAASRPDILNYWNDAPVYPAKYRNNDNGRIVTCRELSLSWSEYSKQKMTFAEYIDSLTGSGLLTAISE